MTISRCSWRQAHLRLERALPSRATSSACLRSLPEEGDFALRLLTRAGAAQDGHFLLGGLKMVQENMHKAENEDIPLILEAKGVKSGVVRVMELQEQGWTYVKP
jgi:hypothetical protein